MKTPTTPTTESAILVKTGNTWELRDIDEEHHCFGSERRPGRLLASGSIKACEAAAQLLGYHIDIIKAHPS